MLDAFINGFNKGIAVFGGCLSFALGCIAVLAVLVTIGTIIAMFHHDSEDFDDE